MTTTTASQTEGHTADQTAKSNDKEFNFRALESKYERQLENVRAENQRVQQELEEFKQRAASRPDDEEEDGEPYVDHKRLNRKLEKFEKKSKETTKADIEQAVQKAIYEERKKTYLDRNPDFYSTIQANAEKLLQKDSELAETILEMPEGFERQKLVYKSIKALGLDKPERKEPSIQDKIDANRKMPFYHPTASAAAPYASMGDFSPAGQKEAYNQMKKLKENLRLG